jgi:uncharacterized protein
VPGSAPPARGPRAALVCHPHPAHGGTLDNKVVHTVAKTLRERGLHVLRFNFRGAGGSEGVHDGGRGELDDARAALDLAATLADAAPDGAVPGAAARGADPAGDLLVAGFSFGSFVGLSAALDDPRAAALLAIAPPVNHYDFTRIAATDKPLFVIYARDDELVPAAEVEDFLARCRRPPRAFRVDGSGHLFHGRLAEIRGAVGEVLASLG